MQTESGNRGAAGDLAEISALLDDERPAVREAAARRAAQLAARGDAAPFLGRLKQLACDDPSQRVRREAAAAIGRASTDLPEAFAMLAALAQHRDPGVVLQAARGLLRASRGCARHVVADPILNQLAAHPNEVVRDFVAVERSRVSQGHKSRGGGGLTAKHRPGSRTG